MFSSSLHHLWIKFYALNIDIISLLEWNWDQKSVCGVYEGTEGKERGEIWNTTQEYWLSSGSRPDLESIPYYAQTCHQTAQMRKVLEATDLREGLFKALFLLLWTYSGEQSYSRVTGSGFGVAALFFFQHCQEAMVTFKACRCFGTFGNLSSTSLQGWWSSTSSW